MVAPIMHQDALKIQFRPCTSLCASPILFPAVACQTLRSPLFQRRPVKDYAYLRFFVNSLLNPISWIWDRCARITFPMVWRTCRFGVVTNDTFFHWMLTILLFCCHASFKGLALTNGFGYIFILVEILHDRQGSLLLCNFIAFESMFFSNAFSML